MSSTWFTIHRSALMPGFSRVASAVDGKSDIPILTHVLFDARNGSLRLRGTDLDLQISADCEVAEIIKEVGFALPARRLSDLLRELPESSELSFGPGRSTDHVGIRTGRSTFSMPSLPLSDFPEMRGRGDLSFFDIDGARLSDALARTAYALNKNDDRMYLTGFCLHADADATGIVVTATDGLSFANIRLPGSGSPVFPEKRNTYRHVIVPAFGVEPIRKLLDGAKTGAKLAVTDEVLAASYDGVEITTKLIDGIFPAYEAAIPPRSDKAIVAPRDVLTAAVRRVAAVIDDGKNDGLRLRVREGSLEIDILTAQSGFASDVVPCEHTAPAGFQISHNGIRLEKTLGALRSADVELMVTSADMPIVIRPLGSTTETFVLSAMRPRFVAEDAV